MDRFPEAFRRFEDKVDIEDTESAQEFISTFAHWAGHRYIGSSNQINALRKESEKRKLGFDWNLPRWIKKKDYGKYYSKGTQKWKSSVKSGKHRGLNDKQISIMNDAIRKGYSSNKIQRALRNEGLGIRRKELLRNIREMKMKSPKSNTQKYTPRKYRK